jgi:hypothetical protein
MNSKCKLTNDNFHWTQLLRRLHIFFFKFGCMFHICLQSNSESKQLFLIKMIKFEIINDNEKDKLQLKLSDIQESSENTPKSAIKRRKNLTIEQKIEIVERYEKGATQKHLAEIYKIGRYLL